MLVSQVDMFEFKALNLGAPALILQTRVLFT